MNYNHAAMSVCPCVNHYGVSIAMLCGEFYLARRHSALHIVAIPSERWIKDLKDDGFEIIQSLNRNAVPSTCLVASKVESEPARDNASVLGTSERADVLSAGERDLV